MKVAWTDRWTDGPTNRHILIDFNEPRSNLIDLSRPVFEFDEVMDTKKPYISASWWIKTMTEKRTTPTTAMSEDDDEAITDDEAKMKMTMRPRDSTKSSFWAQTLGQ